MYAEIIPYLRLIPSLDFFDYQIPADMNLKCGDLVRINFRNQLKIGLVYKIKKTSPFKNLKSIDSVLNIQLSTVQLKLLYWLSKKYSISKSLSFKTVFPAFHNFKKIRKNSNSNVYLSSLKVSIKKNRWPILKKNIEQINYSKKSLLHYNDANEKNVIILGIIEHNLQQTLIIVPEKKDVCALSVICKKFNPILIHSDLSKYQKWRNYLDISNNRSRVIIGTKQSIFVPTKNIKYIIIDNEEDNSHSNFDQHPKYRVIDIAEQLLRFQSNIKLILTSQAPEYSIVNKYKYFNILRPLSNQIEIVDMAKEKQQGNYSYFSEQLIDSLSIYKKTLLLFNRKGLAKLLLCNNCGELLLYKQSTFCPKCHSANLKLMSYGIDKLVIELKKNFPKKRILGMSKDNKQINIDLNQFDIIIGTNYVLQLIDLNRIDFIGIISIDHQLVIPDPLAFEHVFQLLTHIINLDKPVLLQTNAIDNIIIKAIASGNFDNYYSELSKYYINEHYHLSQSDSKKNI